MPNTTIHTAPAPTVAATADIDGVRVDVIRHNKFRPVDGVGQVTELDHFTASVAGEYAVSPATYAILTDEWYGRPAGDVYTANSSQVHTLDGKRHGELATSKTAKGALAGARRELARRATYAQYAPVAEANIATFTRDQFEALPADATIEPGDLVVINSHGRYRKGVATHVTRTGTVEALAATPSGQYAQGAKGKAGTSARLFAKATPVVPVVEDPAAAEQSALDVPAPAELATVAAAVDQVAAALTDKAMRAERAPVAVGDRVTGRCVTMGTTHTGTVAEILPGRSGQAWDRRYRLVDTGATYSTGGPVEPIVECANPAPAADPRSSGAADEITAIAGRVFAKTAGLPVDDATTRYRMVKARVGSRIVDVHDETTGACLARLTESGAYMWTITLADGRELPGAHATFGAALVLVDQY